MKLLRLRCEIKGGDSLYSRELSRVTLKSLPKDVVCWRFRCGQEQTGQVHEKETENECTAITADTGRPWTEHTREHGQYHVCLLFNIPVLLLILLTWSFLKNCCLKPAWQMVNITNFQVGRPYLVFLLNCLQEMVVPLCVGCDCGCRIPGGSRPGWVGLV